jgi:hypothetical protein
MARNERNVTIEDVTIAFRNFAGNEDAYNRAGDRNFAILLDERMAAKLLEDGWNVKHLKARDEGETPQAYLQVAVSYKSRPPKIAMVTSGNITYLTEELIEQLDWVDIETADITINPYDWAVGDKSGRKAYVHSLFIKIEEDYLQTKWTDWVSGNQQRALPAGNDYIDGEVVEE